LLLLVGRSFLYEERQFLRWNEPRKEYRHGTGPSRKNHAREAKKQHFSGGRGDLGGQLRELRPVGLVHARLEAVLPERLGEHLADFRGLVGVVDLVAAQALADPGLRDPLGIPDGDTFLLEREIARRGGAGVEVL